MYAKTKFYLCISSDANDIMFYVIVPHLFLLIRDRDTLLPILNDAHHGSSYTHINDLRNIHKEVFLNLKTAFSNAPAAIHEECNINFTVYKDKMRIK